MQGRLSIVAAATVLLLAGLAPAVQADTAVEVRDDPRDCVDQMLVETADVATPASSSSDCSGGGGGDIDVPGVPADADVDLSDCRSDCVDRQLFLPAVFGSEEVDLPSVYTVECVFKSGNTEVSTGETVLHDQAECPVPGLTTGTTTEFIEGPSEVVPIPEGVDDDVVATVTTGFCELTVEAYALGAFASTTQTVQCVEP